MRQSVVLAGVGMTLGLGLALLATRGLSNLLFGVSPFDLGIFGGVTGMLLGAAVLASFVPALRSCAGGSECGAQVGIAPPSHITTHLSPITYESVS